MPGMLTAMHNKMRVKLILFLILVLASCEGMFSPEIDPPMPVPPKDEFPAWSPDGTKIIYFHNGIVNIKDKYDWSINPEKRGLWIINSNGTNPRLIINAWYGHGIWEDTETLLASLEGNIYRLPLIESGIDSTGVEQLTESGVNFWPSVSYDGHWIAYDSGYNSIWLMKPDGSKKKRIKQYARMPDYSPNTYRIVYRAWQDDSAEIFSMNDLGLAVLQLTSGGLIDYRKYPKYSPDGEKIAFQEYDKILVMNVDGSDLIQIRFVSEVFELFFHHHCNCGLMPNWSPDSQKIVFVRCGLTDLKNDGTIWTTNIDGSELEQLTFGDE